MFPVFVVMVSLTILISRVKWNFSFKLQRVDIKYRQTLCAQGGGDRLFTFIPVLLPPSPSLALSFHHPLPNHTEISSDFFLLPTRLGFFFSPGLCEMFPGVLGWWGCFFPFSINLFFNFFYFFHGILGWDLCHRQAALLPPHPLASSFHPLSRACSFASVLPLSLFALRFPFGVPSGAVRSEIDSESHGRVPWGAGWAPSSSSSLSYLPTLSAPFLFPQAEFFRLRTSPQQSFHY